MTNYEAIWKKIGMISSKSGKISSILKKGRIPKEDKVELIKHIIDELDMVTFFLEHINNEYGKFLVTNHLRRVLNITQSSKSAFDKTKELLKEKMKDIK